MATQKPEVDKVQELFGRSYQEQLNLWLDMEHEQLIAECKRYGLPESEKQIKNIATLKTHINSFVV